MEEPWSRPAPKQATAPPWQNPPATNRWKGCTARWRCRNPTPASGEQWRAFVGPAMLVSVGYMDPGNWGTDLQGGAQFKYGLLWVVALGQPDGHLSCR